MDGCRGFRVVATVGILLSLLLTACSQSGFSQNESSPAASASNAITPNTGPLAPQIMPDQGRVVISNQDFNSPIQRHYYNNQNFTRGSFVRGTCDGKEVYVAYDEVKRRRHQRDCFTTRDTMYFDTRSVFRPCR